MTRIAYFDCQSGISGDMILAALIDAGVELAALNEAVGSLGLPEVRLTLREVKKMGFRAAQIVVEHPREHAHRHLHHITALIERGSLSERQKALAAKIFTRLAEAEARVHGTMIEKVHFHEVGAADSIADIVGAAVGLDLLGVDRVWASPVAVGGGRIKIAHGEVSVPAPATAELLRGVPIAPSSIQAELATPTGVAVLTTVAERFGPLPPMTIDRTGCGAGQRDFEQQPNVLRLYVGELAGSGSSAHCGTIDQVVVLETNLDDISGQWIGYATERLLAAGALDVFTAPIGMKKNRPGVMLSVICRPEDVEPLEGIIFAETTTLGIRRRPAQRSVLPRGEHQVTTPWGVIAGKVAFAAGGPRFAPEYESCRAVAQASGLSLREVFEAAVRAFDPSAAIRSKAVEAPADGGSG